MKPPKRTKEKDINIKNFKEDKAKVKRWVKKEMSNKSNENKTESDGCHCGEDCGAWYNLD